MSQSARRQASTTSLAKYARSTTPDLSTRSLDFCNAFWGPSPEGGVDVLFARMRGASRTVDELKTFWKERCSIEEDYAKRMKKLANTPLGRDEIGELRNSLDVLRLETDKQAAFHATLAQQVRSELEGQTTAFIAKQAHHKKTYQAPIEKEFKAKQTQEGYLNKAREKYEADCLRINSYTAQSTLVQGKDLEKIHLKLERAQQTVVANERDFGNYARVLQDTVQKWETDWKAFCDTCQDLEEERLEFMKDNMWAYANAVSTVCVSDDESCEKMRLALEQMEPDKDMENFVRDYGTGSVIPDPPAFVSYSADAAPAARGTTHPAQFVRSSQRSSPMRSNPPPPAEDEEQMENMAGLGAPAKAAPVQRTPTQRNPNVKRKPTNAGNMSPPAAHVEPTFMKVGQNIYPVDPNNDPQPGGSANRPGPSPVSAFGRPGADDPLEAQLNNLRNESVNSKNRGGSGIWQSDPNGGGLTKVSSTATGSSSLGPPSGGSQPRPTSKDYSMSAESVIGSHPGGSSRPSSPQPPAPVMMQPGSISKPSNLNENVHVNYEQSFPGERKARSRSNSFVGAPSPSAFGHQHTGSYSRGLTQPGGDVGAGVGAHGTRSRSVSPAPQNQVGRPNSYIQAPSGTVQRAHSPGLGIVLGPDGRVREGAMVSYNGAPSSQGQPPYGGPPPSQGYQSLPNQVPGYAPYSQPPQQPYQQQPAPQQPVHQPQAIAYNNTGNNIQRAPSAGGYYSNSQIVPVNGYQPPRTPSPQPPPSAGSVNAPPTGQMTEDGRGILFYVKALYDYQATIEEEFDFQSGDIIAVTATPEDGWWSGELLDEARRQRGRHVFPSNFVCLF